MSQKVRKTLIMIVMAALIICLMAASLTYTFTYGRYAGGKFDEESPYDDLIEFVGAREYTVRSPEELIQAIEDGYSNIKIADDAEEPFVITEGVTDVTANLVLNLNGKVVVRNSRNPMLDVQTNVSVVLVYDSTNKGAFYNPVGSSLMASGGSLTVGSGGYESGPRAKEYQGNEAAGTLSKQPSDVAIYTRGGITSPSAVDRTEQLSYTKIDTKIDASSNFVPATSGRYYRETADSDYTLVPADTFLIYTVEKDCFIGDGTSSGDVKFELGQLYVDAESEKVDNDTIITASEFTKPLCNVASCDFYYYYPISEEDENGFRDYAVIYGYWDVMKLAQDDDGAATALKSKGLIYPYGAVRMVEGEGIVRGGTFSNHFDAVNTYGIYAEGGTLSVSQNTTVDTTFTTGDEGVCIRVQSATEETTTTGEATTTGGSLTISGGEFSSKIGNTIEMSGGNMTVTNGTFKKSGGKGIGSGSGDEQVANQTAMIDMQGGTLNINGSASDSVTMKAGGTDNGGTLTNVFGILAHGGGEVSVGGCTFNINGNYSAGVLSYDGTINLNANTVINVTETHPDDKLTSAGVSSERDTSATSSSTDPHPINMNGKIEITSNGLGITARGMINVKSGTTTVKTENATGIVVSGDADETNGEQQAKLTVESGATLSVESTINSSLKWVNAPGHEGTGDTNVNNGIYVENGSIDASAGTLNVTHTGVAGDTPADSTTDAATKSYAVFVKGDAEGGSQNTTVSINAGTITGTNAGGVYVVGTKQGEDYTATVTLGGVTINAEDTYAAGILTETGNVIIDGNTQITSSALGIAVIDGNVGISDNSTDSSVTATRATGVYVRGGTLYNLGTLSVTSTIGTEENSYLAANAYQYAGADISTSSTNPNPYNGVYVYGGSLTSEGELNVTFTGVESDAPGTGENNSNLNGFNAYRLFQIKSYAVRVEAGTGANTTVKITSGNITNSVGGGVLVNGGTVELGTANDTTGYSANNPTGLTVQTTGTELYYDANSDWISNQLYDAYSDRSNQSNSKSWKYLLSSEGGPAIKIVGGTLKVNGGKYTAQQGDGIVTNGGSSYIYNGVFIGKDSYTILDNDDGISFLKIEGNVTTTSPLAGPAASYAFKVYSGTATVYGGTFGDPSSIASGAFVMGTEDSPGTANIFGGTFDVSDSGDNGGQAGFSAYVYTNVTFTEDGSDENGTGGKITVQGLAAGLTLESAGEGSNNPYQGGSAQVIINSGSFSSMKNNNNSDGIWYGNGSTTLNISSGTFTGAARSGLYFETTPSGNKVQLSGGTYYGALNDVHMERNWANFPECSNNTSYNAIDGNSNMEYRRIVVSDHTANGNTLYDRTINNGTDVADGRCTTTTNGLTEIKNKGEAEVEEYLWSWYTAELVYSQVVIS